MNIGNVKIEGKWKEIPHKNKTHLGQSFVAIVIIKIK